MLSLASTLIALAAGSQLPQDSKASARDDIKPPIHPEFGYMLAAPGARLHEIRQDYSNVRVN